MVCYFHGEVDSAKAVQLKGNDCIIFNSVTTDALLISVSLTLAASPHLASFDAHSLRLHSLVCNNGAASRAEVIISALDLWVMLNIGENCSLLWRVRFAVWPAPDDYLFEQNRPRAFFYEIPHDHNFNLLTLCIHGPGYEIDFCRYDHIAVQGYVGESVALKNFGRHHFKPGEIWYYESSSDIHIQYPPAALSMSMNSLERHTVVSKNEQFHFDVTNGTITEKVSRESLTWRVMDHVCNAFNDILGKAAL